MARLRYLCDTSVFARSSKPIVQQAFAPLAARAEVALCAPVIFELLYSARSLDDLRLAADRLAAYPLVDTSEADHRRALVVQELLAARGQHRALSLVDGLVAAAAERRSLIVLHYDRDFELVASVTGQAHEWIVPRGSAS